MPLSDFHSLRTMLENHVPAGAAEYCLSLWERYRFDFALRKKRVTKIGDFCFEGGKTPRITVNQDLQSYLFLTTYIHEIAHLTVHLNHGRRAEAHGREWKEEFQRLLKPLLSEEIYPADLLQALTAHMADPMATTYSDSGLMKIFRKYDDHALTTTLLADIPRGSIFELRGRWFKKEETKRTRILCQEVKTKKKYLVPADAAVNNIQLSLL
jgi:SprT protein